MPGRPVEEEDELFGGARRRRPAFDGACRSSERFFEKTEKQNGLVEVLDVRRRRLAAADNAAERGAVGGVSGAARHVRRRRRRLRTFSVWPSGASLDALSCAETIGEFHPGVSLVPFLDHRVDVGTPARSCCGRGSTIRRRRRDRVDRRHLEAACLLRAATRATSGSNARSFATTSRGGRPRRRRATASVARRTADSVAWITSTGVRLARARDGCRSRIATAPPSPRRSAALSSPCSRARAAPVERGAIVPPPSGAVAPTARRGALRRRASAATTPNRGGGGGALRSRRGLALGLPLDCHLGHRHRPAVAARALAAVGRRLLQLRDHLSLRRTRRRCRSSSQTRRSRRRRGLASTSRSAASGASGAESCGIAPNAENWPIARSADLLLLHACATRSVARVAGDVDGVAEGAFEVEHLACGAIAPVLHVPASPRSDAAPPQCPTARTRLRRRPIRSPTARPPRSAAARSSADAGGATAAARALSASARTAVMTRSSRATAAATAAASTPASLAISTAAASASRSSAEGGGADGGELRLRRAAHCRHLGERRRRRLDRRRRVRPIERHARLARRPSAALSASRSSDDGGAAAAASRSARAVARAPTTCRSFASASCTAAAAVATADRRRAVSCFSFETLRPFASASAASNAPRSKTWPPAPPPPRAPPPPAPRRAITVRSVLRRLHGGLVDARLARRRHRRLQRVEIEILDGDGEEVAGEGGERRRARARHLVEFDLRREHRRLRHAGALRRCDRRLEGVEVEDDGGGAAATSRRVSASPRSDTTDCTLPAASTAAAMPRGRRGSTASPTAAIASVLSRAPRRFESRTALESPPPRANVTQPRWRRPPRISAI